MVEKSEAFHIFKEFKAFVEKQSGSSLSVYELIEEESTTLLSSRSFAKNMESSGSSPPLTLRNKMESLNAKTERL